MMPLSNAMGKKLLAVLLSALLVLTTIPAIPIARAEGTDWTGYTPITSPAELNNVRSNLAGKYYLTADIVFTADDFASGGAFYNGGMGWSPIGASSTSAFTGIFDGNGHVITGLYCNWTSSTDVVAGLFGYNKGLIQNLGMTDGDIGATVTTDNDAFAGGVAAYNYGTSAAIRDCYNTGTVIAITPDIAISSGNAFAGGIAGENTGSITGCHNTGNVTATDLFGGITGYHMGSALNNCYNTGTIGTTSYTGTGGGIAGGNRGSISNCFNKGNVYAAGAGGILGSSDGNAIYNCYNAGNVSVISYSSRSAKAGGIVAHSTSVTINNCYNSGSVSVTAYATDAVAGGIAGYNGSANVNHCYNRGKVTATSTSGYKYEGGIIGDNSITLSYCYSLNSISKIVGNNYGVGTSRALSADEMKQQASYIDFDFTNTWQMSGDYLPYLRSIPYNAVTSVAFVEPNIQLGTGATHQTKLTLMPSTYTFADIQYTSLNTNVATVDQNGFITVVNMGSANIIAKELLTNTTAFCTVTIQQGVTGIAITTSQHSMDIGDELQLNATVSPADAANKILSWSSDNSPIASVDQNGLVTAHLPGFATITTTSTDGTNHKTTFDITVMQYVQSVSLNTDTLQMNIGTSQTLAASVLPLDATNKAVTWSSSNTTVATVDTTGKITGRSLGTAVITAKTVDGGFEALCTVTVIQPVTGISFAQPTVNIGLGYQLKLAPIITPANATNQNVSWLSSDPSVSVSSDGIITGVSIGSSVITVTTENENKSTMCVVNVGKAVTSIGLNKPQLTLVEGLSQALAVDSILPEDAINKVVTWKTSDASVATVDSSGYVTALDPGTAVISAESCDGSGIAANCSVTVNARSLVGIEVTKLPTKLTYREMAIFDSTGMALTLSYDNGSTAPVTSGWTTNYDFSVSGSRTVVVQYGGFSAELHVTVSPFAITFDSRGGMPVSGTTAHYNATISKPTDPTRTGYTFGGWYKQAACTTAWNFATDKVTADITLYAKWTPTSYTVAFNSQGGSTVASGTASYNATITAPAAPTRAGYTFGGWYKQAACTTAWNFATDKVTADITLYAKWNPTSYTVAFNSQGGSAVTSKTASYNATITAPAAPTRTGYTFAGWYKQAACTTAWNFATDKVTVSTTLYAKWTVNKYTITATVNNIAYGTVSGGGGIAYGTSVTVKATPKAGYRFVRWLEGTTAVSTSPSYTFTVTKARTLKAEFAKIGTPTVKAAPAGYNSVKLTWAAVTGAAKYEVYRATSSAGTYTKLTETTATSYTSTGLTTGTTYYYKVRVKCAAGSTTTYGSYSATVPGKPVPSVPTVVKAASASYNSVKLTWGAVTGASGYEVYRATSSSGAYGKVTTITSGSTVAYTNTGLTTGATYYYKVKAYRTVGSAKVYGGYSAIVPAKPVPAAPAGAKAARASASSVKVSWNAVAGASGYEVYRALSSGGTYSLMKSATTLNWTNTGLTTGKTYYYKVRAYRLVGGRKVYGGYSAAVSARP